MILSIFKNQEATEHEKESIFSDPLSEKLRQTYITEKTNKRQVIFLEKVSVSKVKKWKDLDKESKQKLLSVYMHQNKIIGKISDYAISKVVYSSDTNKIKSANMRKLKK